MTPKSPHDEPTRSPRPDDSLSARAAAASRAPADGSPHPHTAAHDASREPAASVRDSAARAVRGEQRALDDDRELDEDFDPLLDAAVAADDDAEPGDGAVGERDDDEEFDALVESGAATSGAARPDAGRTDAVHGESTVGGAGALRAAARGGDERAATARGARGEREGGEGDDGDSEDGEVELDGEDPHDGEFDDDESELDALSRSDDETVEAELAPPEPSVPLRRVAIVGRPNVGKSTLANRLARRRVSIVDPHAGVTRDRVAQIAELDLSTGRRVIEVVDTGGIGIVDRDDLGEEVERQVHRAIETSDVVLLVVDAREGLTPLDMTVAGWLRGLAKPVLLVANKAEGRDPLWEAEHFRRLGVGEGPFSISAQNGEGLDPLYERIGELLPPPAGVEKRPAPSLRLAVVGRRNAGKSTLINAWANEERVIVSAIPGTTRDAVDVILEKDGKSVVVVDTAGVRRAKSFEDSIDFYSDARSHQAMRNADVVVLLIDAQERVSQIEKKLARYCIDHYKPVILGCNKWDLVGDADPHEFRRYLDAQLPGLDYAPLIFLSAKDAWQVDEVLDLAHELLEQTHRRVGTGELNRVLKKALEARSPSRDGDRVRIFYATQAEETPPTFVLFVNDRKLVGKDYLRYLDNRLREAFGFAEIPVRIHLRDRAQTSLDERRTQD